MALATWLCVTAPWSAFAQQPLRLVTRVSSDEERALLTRVRGQLSDVNATLIVVESDGLERSFREQLEAAQRLAAQHQASVVVWFELHQGLSTQAVHEAIVHIATPDSDRVATRRVQVESGQDASGLLEGAALVVRSATRALSEGGTIGVSREQAIADSLASRRETSAVSEPDTAQTTSSAATTPAQAPAADAPIEVTRRVGTVERDAGDTDVALVADTDVMATPLRVRGLGYVAARALVDGISPVGQWGAHVSGGVALGSFVVLARGTFSVGTQIEIGGVNMRLARHDIGGALGLLIEPTRRWQLLFLAHGAAALHRRHTDASTQAMTAPASTVVSATLGPAFAFSFMPSVLGIRCEVGLDVMATPPRFAVGGTNAPAPITPARLQPYASIGIGARLP